MLFLKKMPYRKRIRKMVAEIKAEATADSIEKRDNLSLVMLVGKV